MLRVTLASLLAVAASAQLVEVGRDCSQSACLENVNGTFTLSCGISGEVIGAVLFASYGNPSGQCPDKETSLVESDVTGLSSNTSCSFTDSAKVIEDACLGEASCEIDTSEITGSGGLVSCPATLTYTVAVQCETAFDFVPIGAYFVIGFIGLALGATITRELVKETWSLHRRAVLIGWLCQFGFMPLIAYLYVVAFEVQPLVALGVLLCGTAPGGTTSNLMTYYAKGNVALSIMMSVASTLCALFMLPLLLFIYGTTALSLDQSFDIPYGEIILSLFVVIIPVSIGIFTREKSEKWAKRMEIGGAVIGVLFLLAALVSGILDNPDLFVPSEFPKTWLGAALFQPIGATLGFLVGKLFKLTGPELRAVVLETGIQNYTIAIAIALVGFSGCERTVVLTFIYTASFWYIINSFWMTLALRYSSKWDTSEEKAEAQESVKLAEM